MQFRFIHLFLRSRSLLRVLPGVVRREPTSPVTRAGTPVYGEGGSDAGGRRPFPSGTDRNLGASH